MLRPFTELRRGIAQDAAQQEQNLRDYFGDEVVNSRSARASGAGITIAVVINRLAPVIAVAILFLFAGVKTAFGQTVRPLDGDSGQAGRSIVAILKWLAIAVLCASIGGIFWAIINGLRGENWQSKLIWSIVGFGASGITAWALDIGQGKDPVFDTQSLGR